MFNSSPSSTSAEWLAQVEQLAQQQPAQAVALAAALPAAVFGSLAGADAVAALQSGQVLPLLHNLHEDALPRCRERQGRWDLSGQAFGLGLPAAEAPARLIVPARQAGSAAPLLCFWLPADEPGLELAAQPGSDGLVRYTATLAIRGREPAWPAPLRADFSQLPRLQAAARLAHAALACGLAQALQRHAIEHLDQRGPSALPLAEATAQLAAARALLHAAGHGDASPADAAQALYCASRCVQQLQALAELPPLHAALQYLQAAAGPPQAQAAALLQHLQPTRIPRKSPAMSRKSSAADGRSTDRVTEILDAAAEAFNSQGYDATSIDHIGDTLGITKGSIYHHYRSKADLLVAVYQRVMEINFNAIAPIAQDRGLRPVQRIQRMAHTHALQVLRHLSYQRLAVQGLEAQLIGRVNEEQREKLQDIIALRHRYEELFLQVLQEAMDAGEIPLQNIRLSIKPFFGAINGATLWYRPRPDETAADREQIAAQLAAFVVSGLALAVPALVSAPSP
ncbi:hypothetical protein GCM10027082_36490 [Comamonas humi]